LQTFRHAWELLEQTVDATLADTEKRIAEFEGNVAPMKLLVNAFAVCLSVQPPNPPPKVLACLSERLNFHASTVGETGLSSDVGGALIGVVVAIAVLTTVVNMMLVRRAMDRLTRDSQLESVTLPRNRSIAKGIALVSEAYERADGRS